MPRPRTPRPVHTALLHAPLHALARPSLTHRPSRCRPSSVTSPQVKEISSAAELLGKPPNLDAHVFCVALQDCPPLTLSGSGESVVLANGEVALLPYRPLRRLIESQHVQLT